jgi:hypothetical protein
MMTSLLEVGDDLLGDLRRKRAAMPAGQPLDAREALALHRLREDHARRAPAAGRAPQRRRDLRHVMPVDDQRAPAKGGEATLVGAHVVVEHGRPRLAETVHVDDADQVIDLRVGGQLGGFPHRALGDLAITHEDEDAGVRPGESRTHGEAEADAEALPERAGRHVDERQPRGGMALEVTVDLPQVCEVVTIHHAHRGPCGIQQRRRVSLAEHEPVGDRVARMIGIDAHGVEEHRGREIGRRGAGRGVTACGRGGGAYAVDSKLGGDVLQGEEPRIGRHTYSHAPERSAMQAPLARWHSRCMFCRSDGASRATLLRQRAVPGARARAAYAAPRTAHRISDRSRPRWR